MCRNRSDYFTSQHGRFAEGISAFLLILIGWYAVVFPESDVIHKSFSYGFMRILPGPLWICMFMGVGLFQLWCLCSGSFIGRAVSTFCAATLFLWGALNVFIYSHYWHIGLTIWGVLAAFNLHVLARILQILEKAYELLGSD